MKYNPVTFHNALKRQAIEVKEKKLIGLCHGTLYGRRLKDKTLSFRGAVCHGGLGGSARTVKDRCIMTHVINTPMLHRTKEQHNYSITDAKFYLNWLMNQSHYAHVFITKDVDWAWEYGVVLKCNVYWGHLLGALTAVRYLQEDCVCSLFTRFIKFVNAGVDNDVAFYLSHWYTYMVKKSGGGGGGHCCLKANTSFGGWLKADYCGTPLLFNDPYFEQYRKKEDDTTNYCWGKAGADPLSPTWNPLPMKKLNETRYGFTVSVEVVDLSDQEAFKQLCIEGMTFKKVLVK